MMTNKQIANYFFDVKLRLERGRGICSKIMQLQSNNVSLADCYSLIDILREEFILSINEFDDMVLSHQIYVLKYHNGLHTLGVPNSYYFFTLGAGFESRIKLLNLIIDKYDKLGEVTSAQ